MTVGQVTLRTTDRRHTLTAWLGPNEPTMTGGRGGWSTIQRPRKPSAVEWVGPDAVTATIELLLDGYRTNSTIQGAINAAWTLAPLRPAVEPPVFTVSGHPAISSTVPWTAQGLEFSGWELRGDGVPIRVTATFSLVEYHVADVVTKASPAKRSATRNGGSAAKPRTYTVKAGDTLGGIAARLLGSASRWTELRTLNGIRDGNHLSVGYVMKIPTK